MSGVARNRAVASPARHIFAIWHENFPLSWSWCAFFSRQSGAILRWRTFFGVCYYCICRDGFDLYSL